ncbi:hypothetical protein [Rhizobium sp. MHM7A]|uniref:hypothetical protein n=1 Tax=Rhizobium sp. MHM7A TaxID=2583233 RepID=UPI001106E22E|nr:hypothetical protein [Rhizobium sp. MHM7A]TLX17146.1 hypothetical protein FFR93_07505 [Rhizobium sp. MHM7A]
MTDDDWKQLLNTVAEIQEFFQDGLVFIGGIAVYAHALSKEETAIFAAQSHDADFMILLSDYADLRDIEMLTPNRRLSKQQFVKQGFEFDVYVEGQTDLCVPVQEAVAFSEVKSGLRVACIEHLLVLKAKALADRRGTPKGDKDEDDVARMLLVADGIDKDKLTRLTDDLLLDLQKAVKGDAAMRLADGNSHKAKSLRMKINEKLQQVEEAHQLNYGGPTP